MRVTVDSRFHRHVSGAAGRVVADLTETSGGQLAGVSCASRLTADFIDTLAGLSGESWQT